MARSSSELVAFADGLLLQGMGFGTLLMMQPIWAGGLKWGFFVTLACTVLEIATGHLLPDEQAA